MSALLERLGRRFARFVTTAVVARPGLWRVLRRPLRSQFEHLAPVWDKRRGAETMIPLGRFADPKEITAAVMFLAGEEAGYITGTVLPVDGGIAM